MTVATRAQKRTPNEIDIFFHVCTALLPFCFQTSDGCKITQVDFALAGKFAMLDKTCRDYVHQFLQNLRGLHADALHLKMIARKFKRLHFLSISNSADCLLFKKTISSLRHLKLLSIKHQSHLTDASLLHLPPSLEILRIVNCTKMRHGPFYALEISCAKFINMIEIEFSGKENMSHSQSVCMRDLLNLSSLPRFKTLHLSNLHFMNRQCILPLECFKPFFANLLFKARNMNTYSSIDHKFDNWASDPISPAVSFWSIDLIKRWCQFEYNFNLNK